LTMRVTGTECEKLALVPTILKVKLPVLDDGLGLIVSVEVAEVVVVEIGLGLKLALILEGSPLTLRVTELDTPPTALSVTLY
jgi:hypothetical protein